MPVEKLTSRIEKYSRRTLNLADEFLRLAKAERARAEDFETIDLSEAVRDAIDEAWTLARQKQIRIVSGDFDEAWILGDRDLITRVVVNLLSNAVKYSEAETEIQSSSSEKGSDKKHDSSDEETTMIVLQGRTRRDVSTQDQPANFYTRFAVAMCWEAQGPCRVDGG